MKVTQTGVRKSLVHLVSKDSTSASQLEELICVEALTTGSPSFSNRNSEVDSGSKSIQSSYNFLAALFSKVSSNRCVSSDQN